MAALKKPWRNRSCDANPAPARRRKTKEEGGGGFATDALDVSENLANAPPLPTGGTDSKMVKCNAPPPRATPEISEGGGGNRQN
jgi:hypothetical protein